MRARRPERTPSATIEPGEHVSVLLDEVLEWLRPRSGGWYVDCTLGNGGHAAAILEQSGPDGRLLGLDADPAAIVVAGERLAPFGARATLVNTSFRDIAS